IGLLIERAFIRSPRPELASRALYSERHDTTAAGDPGREPPGRPAFGRAPGPRLGGARLRVPDDGRHPVLGDDQGLGPSAPILIEFAFGGRLSRVVSAWGCRCAVEAGTWGGSV